MFEQMMNDTIHLVKPDGGRVEGIKAVVQPTEIITLNTALDLATGDRIEREGRGGQVDTFVVLGAVVVPPQGSIPTFCRLQVRKEEAAKAAQPAARVVYGVTGPATKLHLSALDRQTVIHHVSPAVLFEKLAEAAAGAIGEEGSEGSPETAEEVRQLAERIAALAESFGTPDFAPRYVDFVALASRRMPVFAPFLPALGQLLGS